MTIDLCHHALDISRRLGYQRGMAEALRTRGNCYLLMSEYDLAKADEMEALQIFEFLGDGARALRVTNIIGNIHRRRGDLPAALATYHEVLHKARDNDDRLMQASALNNIGNIYYAKDFKDEAAEYYHQALEIFQEMGEVHYATMTLINLSSIYRTGGQLQKALDCCRRALSFFPEYGDRQAEAATWFDMGLSYRDLGMNDRALKVWQKSMDLARQVGDVVTEMSALVHTAELLADPEHVNESLELLELAAPP